MASACERKAGLDWLLSFGILDSGRLRRPYKNPPSTNRLQSPPDCDEDRWNILATLQMCAVFWPVFGVS